METKNNSGQIFMAIGIIFGGLALAQGVKGGWAAIIISGGSIVVYLILLSYLASLFA